MPHLKLSFLGAAHVTLNGKPVQKFRSIKAQALLAYLATESNQPHTRKFLAELFWPEKPIAVALQNLRQTLHRLCLALNGHDSQAATASSFLSITRYTLQFNTGSDYWLDVAEFLTCLERGRQERAVELYRDHFLTELYLPDSVAFEQWATMIRERLHSQILHVLNQLTQHYLALAAYDRVQFYARRQLALEPWHEQAHRQLMLALVANGQRVAALAQYKICCHILMQELGIEPAAKTTALYARIRDGESLSFELSAQSARATHTFLWSPGGKVPAQVAPKGNLV
jgi:DNA-binding SARP family transcriptional activator